MSLTEEARAPFSLVDEINQGMDRRAERIVHNSLVRVTCQPDSAQYFLITPKLLEDLDYHERMKVLCVNNGEWLPDENQVEGVRVGDLKGLVGRYMRSKRA
jgi:structural maintenance of chromosomes protein 5